MAKIAIQFHAIPEELLALVKPFAKEFGLHLIAMRFFPFAAIEVNPEELDEIFSDKSAISELALTVKPPLLPVNGNLEFGDKNPDKLRLNFQRITPKGLRQSFIHARTDHPATLEVWRQFAKRLRKMTKSGVSIVNPDTGVTGEYRAFRYSAGAKAMASTGVQMFPVAGDNLVKFP